MVAVLELTDYATLVQKASIMEAGSDESLNEKENKKRKVGSKGGGSWSRIFSRSFDRRTVSQPAKGLGI